MDIAHGRVDIGHIRELAERTCSGRISARTDFELMSGAIRGGRRLVMGAGGSIGKRALPPARGA